MNPLNHQLSSRPETDLRDLLILRGPNDPESDYRPGYGYYMDCLPVLIPDHPFLEGKIGLTKYLMETLAKDIHANDAAWLEVEMKLPGEFSRTMLALEAPDRDQAGTITKQNAEIILAHWGMGYSSPVHGHAPGYMHEAIMYGKMRVNTYRMIDPSSNVVRPLRTEIVGPGTFVSQYAAPNPSHVFPRQNLIHNFTALTAAASLHYLPEHTRDGKDNGFKVEFFEDVHHLEYGDVFPINAQEGMYLQKGDVVLVRSSNVPDYGDHYIVITGHPVSKEHGMRPQDIAIQAPGALATILLNTYSETRPELTLLKLGPHKTKQFHAFHGISISNGNVTFPNT